MFDVPLCDGRETTALTEKSTLSSLFCDNLYLQWRLGSFPSDLSPDILHFLFALRSVNVFGWDGIGWKANSADSALTPCPPTSRSSTMAMVFPFRHMAIAAYAIHCCVTQLLSCHMLVIQIRNIGNCHKFPMRFNWKFLSRAGMLAVRCKWCRNFSFHRRLNDWQKLKRLNRSPIFLAPFLFNQKKTPWYDKWNLLLIYAQLFYLLFYPFHFPVWFCKFLQLFSKSSQRQRTVLVFMSTEFSVALSTNCFWLISFPNDSSIFFSLVVVVVVVYVCVRACLCISLSLYTLWNGIWQFEFVSEWILFHSKRLIIFASIKNKDNSNGVKKRYALIVAPKIFNGICCYEVVPCVLLNNCLFNLSYILLPSFKLN